MKQRIFTNRHICALLAACSLVCFCLAIFLQVRFHVHRISVKPPPGMTEATVYVYNKIKNPVAAILLANGYNNCSGSLALNSGWRRFARKNQLLLVELAFASDPNRLHDSGSYYFAADGSGQVLLDMIDSIYPQKLPLFMFGFSGGGSFVSSFQKWAPDRVRAWIVHGTGFWENTPDDSSPLPPGLITCGEEDSNLEKARDAFEKRQSAGQNVTWRSFPDTGHWIPPSFTPEIQAYFMSYLDKIDSKPESMIFSYYLAQNTLTSRIQKIKKWQ